MREPPFRTEIAPSTAASVRASPYHMRITLTYSDELWRSRVPEQPTPKPVPPQQLHTVQAVAQALGLSTRRVRELIAKGQLVAVNVSSGDLRPRFRITDDAYQDFVARRVIT